MKQKDSSSFISVVSFINLPKLDNPRSQIFINFLLTASYVKSEIRSEDGQWRTVRIVFGRGDK
jgi:hypothetical protein